MNTNLLHGSNHLSVNTVPDKNRWTYNNYIMENETTEYFLITLHVQVYYKK